MVDANRKGNVFMRELDPWVRAIFPRASRTGKGFQGSDYTDTEDFCIEAKNHSKMAIGEWMTQTELNTIKEHRRFPVVIHKRRRFTTSRAYVTMPLEQFFTMLAELKGIELPTELTSQSSTEVPDWGPDIVTYQED